MQQLIPASNGKRPTRAISPASGSLVPAQPKQFVCLVRRAGSAFLNSAPRVNRHGVTMPIGKGSRTYAIDFTIM